MRLLSLLLVPLLWLGGVQAQSPEVWRTVRVAQKPVNPKSTLWHVGSGFLYQVKPDGTGVFLTARHVVARHTATFVMFYTKDGRKLYARVNQATIKRHDVMDVATFEVPKLPAELAKTFTVDGDLPAPESASRAVGYGPEGKLVDRVGPVLGYGIANPIGPAGASRFKLEPGMSGGPVFGSEGKVIGVISAKREDKGYWVPVALLGPWLKK